jgi:hypothetical protein
MAEHQDKYKRDCENAVKFVAQRLADQIDKDMRDIFMAGRKEPEKINESPGCLGIVRFDNSTT